MTIESVRRFFAEHAPDLDIIELEQSTATVALAAEAHGVAPGQIAKTLSLRAGGTVVLVVARGDARLDNRKLRQAFGGRTKMLPADEVADLTGHPVGGVSLWPDSAPTGLLRHQPARFRHRHAGSGFHPQRSAHHPRTPGPLDRRVLGGCMPGRESCG